MRKGPPGPFRTGGAPASTHRSRTALRRLRNPEPPEKGADGAKVSHVPFGIGVPELLILLVVLLLVFGAKRLPEMGKSLGKGMREFKDGISGLDDTVTTTPPTTAPAPPQQLPAATSEPAAPAPAASVPAETERETVR